MNANARRHQIDRFLHSGDYDLLFRDWPGQHILDKMQRGHDDLLEALVSEIRRRQAKITLPCLTVELGCSLTDFAREKLAPMVHGLFPRREWAPVLALLENSVVFLTPDDIESVIRRARDFDTA